MPPDDKNRFVYDEEDVDSFIWDDDDDEDEDSDDDDEEEE